MTSSNRSSRPTRHQRRLSIPERGGSDTPEGLAPVRGASSDVPSKKHDSLDGDNLFGFDEAPADNEKMDDVRFVDIFKAWGKRTIQHSPIEKYLATTKAKKKHLKRMKNDLKWAMQADLDEPVAPRPKQPKAPAHPPAAIAPPPPTAPPDSKTIDININFGSLPKIKRAAVVAKAREIFKKHKKIIASGSVIAIGVLLYVLVWPTASQYIESGNQVTGGTDPAAKAPDYLTVLPKDKSISNLGGWKRVSPSESNPVFAYADKVDDVTISVSQQPLPEAFKTDISGNIADLAKQFSATEKIDANGTDVYIGTSAKGPQSVIFSKNGLLVLIKSQQKAESKSWKAYVESLVGTDPTLSNF